MERQEPVVSWEFAISTRLPPLSSAEMTRGRQNRPKGCLNLSCASDNGSGDAQRCKRSRQSGGRRDRDAGRREGETEPPFRGRRQNNRSPETVTQAETQEEGAQATKLHNREGQTCRQVDPRLGRQTSLRLLPVSRLLGKPATAAAATITPDSFWPCRPPLCSPSPIAPAIISLVQNELLQLQPRQLFHPGASTGAGWLDPRGAYVLLRQGGMGMREKERRLLDTPRVQHPSRAQ